MRTLAPLVLSFCWAALSWADAPAPVQIEHEVRKIEGWTIHVDVALLEGEAAGVGKLGLRLLGDKLHAITLMVPESRLEKLRQVPIYVDHQHPLRAMQYHPGAGWLKDHGYDPAMVKCVHIPRLQRLIDHESRYDQPWAVLHELAHAFHDRELGFGDKEIRAAFERVRDAGLYDKVLHIRGHETRHYALTNEKEFFAEMTESFLGTNDFFPFVRGELARHDKATYELLKKVWGK